MSANGSTPPSSAADMLVVARALLDRFYHSQEFPDLFAAVLASVHVVEWHFTTSPDSKMTDEQKERLRKGFPEYTTLSDLANGLKHGLFPLSKAPPSEARKLVLKKIDAWDGDCEDDALDGWHHLGGPDYWIVKHDERRHSVFLLCERFLGAVEEMIQT